MNSHRRFPAPRAPRRRPGQRRPAFDALEQRALLANVGPNLTLVLASHVVPGDSSSSATTGTLTRGGTDNTLALTVSLASSNPTAVVVPATVVIPAGQASATFGVTSPYGGAPVDDQAVTITGSATAEVALARDFTFTAATQPFITEAMAVQPDGKVVVVGDYYTGNSSNYYRMAAIRYNADGSLDSTFHGGTPVYVGPAGQSWRASAVAVRPSDGEIFVGGDVNVPTSSVYDFAVARIGATGTLDGTTTQTQASGTDISIAALAVQPDGKVLVGGTINTGYPNYGNFGVVRLNVDGTLDSSYGNGGLATVAMNPGSDIGYGVALQGDGKVVVGGTIMPGNSTSQFAAARFTPTGQVDASNFGSNGTVQIAVASGNLSSYAYANAIALQPDGKILLAGSVNQTGVYPPTANDVALVRYNANGTLDRTFGNSGVLVQDLGGNDVINAMAVEPDGTIVVGGKGGASGGTLIARFTPTGTLDTTTAATGGAIVGLGFEPNGRVVAAVGPSTPTTFSGTTTAYTGTAALAGSDTLTVQGSADPRATPDGYKLSKSTPLVVAAPGVLANDVDPTGLPLSAVLVAGPTHGSLTLNADGSFTYTPKGAYLGPDSFTYKDSDGAHAAQNVATVSLYVAGTDDPPVAGNDSYTFVRTSSTSTLAVAAPGVLANDSDVNGQAITAQLVGNGTAHGYLALNADGSFTYTPFAGYYGADSFTYQANDGTLAGNVATVAIQVQGAPVAVSEKYTLAENTPLAIKAPGILGNDVAYNGLPLKPVVTTGPTSGTLALNADGSFTYTPKPNFFGTDSFAYYATDGLYASNTVVDTFTVNHVNQPPAAVNDSYATNEDTPLPAPAGVTSIQMTSQPGDFVGGGRSYSYTSATASISARVLTPGTYANTVEVNVSSGSELYTLDFQAPNLGRLVPGMYYGATRWPFEAANTPGLDVSIDSRGSNTSTGRFTVYQADYDASGHITAFAADFTQYGDGSTAALTGRVLYNSTFASPASVLANDTDPDGDLLTATLVAGPTHGSLSLSPDGTFNYVPALGFSGTDQFTYMASDGTLSSNVATATITVNQARPIDDPSFEAAAAGSAGYAYNPAGSAWAFSGAPGSGSGVSANGTAFTVGNPGAPQGTQVAFLQGYGDITQNVYNWAAGSYAISFQAAQRGNYNASAQDFQVLVDGVVVGTFRPTTTTYQTYATPAFTVAAGAHTIRFDGLDTAGGDNTAFLDAVAVAPATPPAVTVSDGGFEAAAAGSAGYAYNPAGSAWAFSGAPGSGSGVSANGTAFTVGNPGAPQGSQVAFLQGYGTITQAIDGWAAGSYAISFQAAQRGNYNASAQDFQVLVDGTVVGTFRPTGKSYQAYQTAPFAVGAGRHTVTFQGLDTAGGDNTAFLDAVAVVAAPTATVSDGGFEAAAAGSAGYAYNPAGSAWAFSGAPGSGSGVSANGTAFTVGNPGAPQGSQVAFLQGYGTITQAIDGWAAGSYAISFQAAQRGNYNASAQDFQVLVDGVVVGTFRPTTTTYQTYRTASFAVGAGRHTITFQGLDTAGGDNTAFLDDVRLGLA